MTVPKCSGCTIQHPMTAEEEKKSKSGKNKDEAYARRDCDRNLMPCGRCASEICVSRLFIVPVNVSPVLIKGKAPSRALQVIRSPRRVLRFPSRITPSPTTLSEPGRMRLTELTLNLNGMVSPLLYHKEIKVKDYKRKRVYKVFLKLFDRCCSGALCFSKLGGIEMIEKAFLFHQSFKVSTLSNVSIAQNKNLISIANG